MNGVNLLYKNIDSTSFAINVQLVGIIVSTTASSSPWTELHRVRSSGRWDTVDAEVVLGALREWASSTDILPAHDHLMLFVGYDLTRPNKYGEADTGVTGLAYTSTMCMTEGRATSIVEDLGGLQCIITAAHELGHGLSANHDGSENLCSSADRYIMANSTQPVTPSNKLNPWRFSSCSLTYFSNFISQSVFFARRRQCLDTRLEVSGNVPDVTSLMPGQLYDPNQQCRQMFGAQSRLCQGSAFGQTSDICTGMFCFDPSTTSQCVKLVAARGTTCGNQKWCVNGRCVLDPAAPVADDSCVFGDSADTINGKDCRTLISEFPGYCYQETVRSRCCGSCRNNLRLVTGCDYGDKATGCGSRNCASGIVNQLQLCCGTCNYGTPYTTTPASTIAPAFCMDRQGNCPDLVAQQPQRCYDVTFRSSCCPSCRRIAFGARGCEYGDRDPGQCAATLSGADSEDAASACRRLQSLCCQTCSGGDGPPSSAAAAVWRSSSSSSIITATTTTTTISSSFISMGSIRVLFLVLFRQSVICCCCVLVALMFSRFEV
ncbi:metalloprotease mig-17-like [Babylonia areolata]|uniref:metalloprotease mig-17-like n=1 Tax=Babylonia areolata TaxID=304850 RepID=UPI003FCFD6CD